MTQDYQEDLFGSTFRFKLPHYDTVFTYVNPVEHLATGGYPKPHVRRYHLDGGFSFEDVTVEDARLFVQSGQWIILPSEQLQKPSTSFSEDAFTLAEKTAKAALFPVEQAVVEVPEWQTIQEIVQDYLGASLEGSEKNITTDGITTYFIERIGEDITVSYKWRNPSPTFAEVVEESGKGQLDAARKMMNDWNNLVQQPKESALDTIKKACTASQGRIVVQITKDGYEVFHHYFYVDSVKAEDESKLKDFLEALCLVDGMDSWSDV